MDVRAGIGRVFSLGLLSVFLSATANADTLNLAAGTLTAGSTNNEFLLEFGLNGTGIETPYPAFLNDGTTLIVGSPVGSFPQAANPSFTFDFSFFVASEVTLSENPTYLTFVGSTTSSISLMQGNNVIDTGVQTTPTFVGTNYFLPPVSLQPGTQYDLVVTTLGVPSTFDVGITGTQGWGQVAVDASPGITTPEPSMASLLAISLLAGSLILHSRRVIKHSRNATNV